MTKQTDNEIKIIKKLLEKDEFFQYEIDYKNDNFFNDSYQFLDQNELKIVVSFKDLMFKNYVIRNKDENEFMYRERKVIGLTDELLEDYKIEKNNVYCISKARNNKNKI